MPKRCCTCSIWFKGYCWWHFIERPPRAKQCNEYSPKLKLKKWQNKQEVSGIATPETLEKDVTGKD